MKNYKLIYHFIITILFVYIFLQFLTFKNTNYIYNFYTKYVMNKYCIILYICLLFLIIKYDTYTTILLFLLIIGPFKCSTKEYFEGNILSTTQPITTQPITTQPITTQPITTQPITTQQQTLYSNRNKISKLIDKQVTNDLLGIDDRFKMDEVKKNEILKQIKAQITFDPYKTDLSKDVINEIYNKYFDNDIFIKLNTINEDSKDYIAAGNFKYIPTQDKVNYDMIKYEDLTKNNAFIINGEFNDTNKSL